ncbi:MAG: SPOR domain-containing protein [Deltaproteobacteria bacterium]
MDKRYSQLELFSGGRGPETVREDAGRTPFILQVNRYEKTIFMIIGFLVTGICFYCLGVDHGKKVALASNRGMDLASRVPVSRPAAAATVAVQERKAEQVSTSPMQAMAEQARMQAMAQQMNAQQARAQAIAQQMKARTAQQTVKPASARTVLAARPGVPQSGVFTVQIGTYEVLATAERERQKLAQKGFSPQIVKKGAYNVVCVGAFADKETARSLLSKLRQNYRDCYIRRL